MKDILVVASAVGSFPVEVRYAAELARALRADLTGLFVVEPFSVPAMFDPAAAALLELKAHELLEQARDDRAAFLNMLRERGVARGDWLVAHGPELDATVFAASWHDLVVLGLQQDDTDSIAAASAAVLSAGVPFVLVPASHAGTLRRERIAVACNGSRESIRALHASLPLLKLGKRVVLMQGGQRKPLLTAMGEPPAFDPEAYLARHDIGFERCFLDDPDQTTGEEIAETAVAMDADLLVMGAYGRSRLSEIVLGGATRRALHASGIPLFVQH